MILRFCLAASLLAAVLGTALVQAARLDNLFQAQVAAAGRDTASRDAALRQALQEVLVRATGSSAVLHEPAAASLLQDPGRFVQQYGFSQDEASAPLELWAHFDDVSLTKEIRDLGLPLWGQDRPDVLVWLAVDNQGQRALVSESTDNPAALAVLSSAQRRGLPVSLPLMDLEDQRAVQFTDVWGGFAAAIQAASQRYRPQVILVGKLDRSGAGGGWRSEWTLLGAGSDQHWDDHANSLEQGVDHGIADAAEWLALRYAVVSADERLRRVLVVEDITGLKDYGRVYNYLASLTSVEEVQVIRVAERQVIFNLTLNAQERNLLQIIRLGKMLQPIEDPSSWRFRFAP